jgi:hypothetical protein
MKTTMKVISAIAVVAAIVSMASCGLAAAPSDELVSAAKELKSIIPGILAGMSLVQPDDPTDRALDPAALKSAGATTGNNWGYGTQTPAQVYTAAGGTTGTVRLPSSGNYELTNLNQLYFTLTPEPSLGATYYRLVLYTYPAIDLSVAYTIEEYIVNSAGSESWEWGNLNISKQRDSWVRLTTAYLDGTSGTRTVQWISGVSGQYYPAFTVGTPDPLVPTSFDGYRSTDADTPPAKQAGGMSFSSHVTEKVLGKKTVTDAIQYYTEATSTNLHSGLTYVVMDKQRKWAVDTNIVTRMTEDTTAGTKTIRSVGEVGTDQYYIDKVDIAVVGGKISYTSTHDVYDTALPKGGNPKAKDYVFLDVLEDSAGIGTFTGTMKETQGDTEIVRDVKIDRDNHYRFQVSMKYKSSGARPKALGDDIAIPLTQQDLGNLSIPLMGGRIVFNGFFEAGVLYGSLTEGSKVYDLVVADEGVAIDDQLFTY